jgi:hypothetical protein
MYGFKNIFEVYYSSVYKHRLSIIVIVSKIIIYCDKSNTDNETVYIRRTKIYVE